MDLQKHSPFKKDFFYELDDLVVRKILREYCSVFTKTYILYKIPFFQNFLDQDSSWYKPSLYFFNIVRLLRPGWYVNTFCSRYLYYITIDEQNLTYKIYHINLDYFNVRKRLMRVRKIKTTISSLQVSFNCFKSKITYLGDDNVSLYFYNFNYILIFGNRIHFYRYWPKVIETYNLDNNVSFIKKYIDEKINHLKLTIRDDCTLIIECNPSILKCYCSSNRKELKSIFSDLSNLMNNRNNCIISAINQNEILISHEMYFPIKTRHHLTKMMGLGIYEEQQK